jgi:hypothetical protein
MQIEVHTMQFRVMEQFRVLYGYNMAHFRSSQDLESTIGTDTAYFDSLWAVVIPFKFGSWHDRNC